MVDTRIIDKNTLEIEIKEQIKSAINESKKSWMDEVEWWMSQWKQLEKAVEINNLNVRKIITKDYFQNLKIKCIGENKWAILIKYKYNNNKHDEEVYDMYAADMDEEGFKGW